MMEVAFEWVNCWNSAWFSGTSCYANTSYRRGWRWMPGRSNQYRATMPGIKPRGNGVPQQMFRRCTLLTGLVFCWAVLSVLPACVTVNVYFPAAAAERAADRIIQDVWSEAPSDAETPLPSPSTPSQGGRPAISAQRIAVWERVLNVFIRPARATADITINTPGIKRLKNAMAARFKKLAAFFSSGAVGITRDGLLAVRDLNVVPLPQRATVKRLVDEDNRDRNALYREIAKANGHPEWESDIRAVFAREWIAKARPGWWYQSAGGWAKK